MINYIKTIWKYGNIPFPSDAKGAQICCALHNLGIVEVKADQVFIRSAEKARQYIAARS